MDVNLKTVRCCASCRYFVFGNAGKMMLDGIPMHCMHPQFLKDEYREEYFAKAPNYPNKTPAFILFGTYQTPEDIKYYKDAARDVKPYNICDKWEGI
jgi:hypothetical protein